VDLSILEGTYRHRSRSKRSVFNSRVSWIYLHGIELEKRSQKTGQWVKHWLCKPCHEKGIIKIMAVTSTWSAARHLESNQHSIFPPGVIPPTAGAAMNNMNSYLEAQHPLQAER
jgi:hypothetical protein